MTAISPDTDSFNSLLGGDDISKILRSDGPTVTCVLLKADDTSKDEEKKLPAVSLESSIAEEKARSPDTTDTAEIEDSKEDATSNGTKSGSEINEVEKEKSSDESHPTLEDGKIKEISIDTTPKKSMVQNVLGGPFTFLGQYEDEGIVLMMKRDQTLDMPRNNHKLQPPFDEVEVRGDILIMRVAETEDDQIEEGNNGENSATSEFLKNEEFFLNYTKDAYIKFAARTDIVATEYSLKEESDNSGDEVENEMTNDQSASDSEDCEFDPIDCEDHDSDEDDEDCQVGMMNLIFGQILKRFREENGRGPDTRELLEMRKALAQKLGVDVPDIDEAGSNWDEKVERKETNKCGTAAQDCAADGTSTGVQLKKRSLESDDANCEQEKKRVKWVIDEETDNTKEQIDCPDESGCENKADENTGEIMLKEGEEEI